MEVPKVKQNELRESIELQIEEYVPLKVSEVAFDYAVLGESKERPGYLQVVISVAPASFVSTYLQVFEDAGLSLLSLDVDAHALARAVIPKNDQSTFMLIDAGRIKTGVYVVSHGAVLFASDIDIGTKAMSSVLEKELSLSPEDALSAMKGAVAEEYMNEKVLPVLLPAYSTLKEEINKHYVYWHTHKDSAGGTHNGERIGRIILCGSGAVLPGLRDILASGLKVSVEMGNPWANTFPFDVYIPEISYEEALRYTIAIGLAL